MEVIQRRLEEVTQESSQRVNQKLDLVTKEFNLRLD